jgi:hypothetical protein
MRLRNGVVFVTPAKACAKPKHLLHRNVTEARLRFGEGRKAGVQCQRALPPRFWRAPLLVMPAKAGIQ